MFFDLKDRIKHEYGIASVSFSYNGDIFGCCGSNRSVKLYNSETRELISTLTGHKSGVNSIHFGNDINLLVSGGDDARVRLWDIVKEKCLTTFRSHTSFVNSVRFNVPKNNLVLSCSADESAIVWDKVSGRMVRKLPAHSNNVSYGTFTCDGTLISTCGYDGLIRLWDTKNGQCLKSLQCGDSVNVGTCRFTPNNKYIIASYHDASIKCWDYRRGKVIRVVFEPTTGEEEEGVKRKYSSYLMSGSEDNSIYLWDINIGKVVSLKVSDCHSGPILSIDKQRNGELFISSSLDETVAIWERKVKMVDEQ